MFCTPQFRVGQGFGPAAGLPPGAELEVKPVGPAILSPAIAPTNAISVPSRNPQGAT